MEKILDEGQAKNALDVDGEMMADLIEASRWARFLAIVGFVGLGLMGLVMIYVLFFASNFGAPSYYRFSSVFVFGLVIAFYYFPLNFLFRFAASTKEGIAVRSQYSLKEGIGNLKAFFKFLGIATLVVIGLYALGIMASFGAFLTMLR